MIIANPYHPKAKPGRKSGLPLLREVEIIYSTPKSDTPVQVTSSKDAYNVFIAAFDKRKLQYKEFFYVLLLNRSNHCIGIAKVSEGGLTSTVVDAREIFQLALKSSTTGIIIAHNHPSGNLRPSDADNKLTKKIKEAGLMLDIQLLDHLIITADGYWSYADEGKLFIL